MRQIIGTLGFLLALGGAGAESWPTAAIGVGLLAIAVLSHGETGNPREEQ